MDSLNTNSRRSCLVVEDNDMLAEMMVMLLQEEMGFSCARFSSGDDALFFLLQGKELPSLVVTDNRMPGRIQGQELSELIAQRWPYLPVILTSGSDLVLPEATSDAKYFFLRKPWSVGQLEDVVEAALSI